MKQIFDWLREQIDDHLNHCKQMAEQSRYFSEEIGYCSRADAYEIALELINEAEAKWEADCCEWTELIEYKQRVYANCRFTNDSLDAMSIGYFKFCPYCGKRIKISEVE